jgi:alpha-beta hydrolase superfamily lysophospholipase
MAADAGRTGGREVDVLGASASRGADRLAVEGSLRDEGRFAARDGLQLAWQCWRPRPKEPERLAATPGGDGGAPRAGAPRAVVVLVHGVGEHSGRYLNLMRPLVADGFAIYAYDQRGHGRSPGPRVHIERWSQYRDDLAAFVALVAAREPGAPLVLYGHSMGSLVVLDYLVEGPGATGDEGGRAAVTEATGGDRTEAADPAGTRPRLVGAVVSGVALQPAGVGRPYQVAMAKALSRIAPRLVVDLGIKPAALTRDPEGFMAAIGDPLLTSKATVRWGAESLAALRRIRAGLSRIELPLLALHGGDDPLNRPAGASELLQAVRSTDTTLRVYPGARHEPHNDACHAQVAADVSAWLGRIATLEPAPRGARADAETGLEP